MYKNCECGSDHFIEVQALRAGKEFGETIPDGPGHVTCRECGALAEETQGPAEMREESGEPQLVSGVPKELRGAFDK